MPWHEDGAFYEPSYYLHGAVCRAARARGLRVLLEGVGGDLVASHGSAYLYELARAGRWIALVRETYALSRAFGIPLHRFVREVGGPLTPRFVRHLWRVVSGRQERPWGSVVSSEFARRIGLAERLEEDKGRWLTLAVGSRTDHWRRLASRSFSDTLEALDGAAATTGLEPRDPFLDRRLVEYCLALPADQKLRRGWTRVAMRHAMSPLWPREIRERKGKADFNRLYPRALAAFGRERLDEVMRMVPEVLGPYVDLAAVRGAYDRYMKTGAPGDVMIVWKVATLALWLRRTKLGPVGAPARSRARY